MSTRISVGSASLPKGLTESHIQNELRIANMVVRSPDQAIKVVAKAVAELPYAAAHLVENRRPRPDREPLDEPRHSYRSFTGPNELLRFLVLDELDQAEIDEERAGRLLTSSQQLLCFTKQVVKTTLNRNSFYAAVGLTEIICDYSAPQTLDMYRLVSRWRAEGKDWPACSRAKRIFERAIQFRFGERIEVVKQANAVKIAARRPTANEIALLRSSLLALVPSVPPESTGETLLGDARAMFRESRSEMKNIHKFFDVNTFDSETRKAPSTAKHPTPAGPFNEHAWVPVIQGCKPDPSPSAPPVPQGGGSDPNGSGFDMDYFYFTLGNESRRRHRASSAYLSVRVDGIDRGSLDQATHSRTMIFEEGANTVRLIARGDDGEPVTFAMYVLTYDEPKIERWEVDLGEGRSLIVTFSYREDETVEANFMIQSASGRDQTVTPQNLRHFVVGVGGTGSTIVSYFLKLVARFAPPAPIDFICIDEDVSPSTDPEVPQDLTFTLDNGVQMFFRPVRWLLRDRRLGGVHDVLIVNSLGGGTGAGCLIPALIRIVHNSKMVIEIRDGQHRASALHPILEPSAIALVLKSSWKGLGDVRKRLANLPAGCGESDIAAHIVQALGESLLCAVPGDLESLLEKRGPRTHPMRDRRPASFPVVDTIGSVISTPSKGNKMYYDSVLRDVILSATMGARAIGPRKSDLELDIAIETVLRWLQCMSADRVPRDHRAWAYRAARNLAFRALAFKSFESAPAPAKSSAKPLDMVDGPDSQVNLVRVIDRLALIEVSILSEFAKIAERKEIDLEPIPRIIQREQHKRHAFGMIAILSLAVEAFAANTLLHVLAPWSVGIVAMTGIVVALSINAWWTFGWSKRLVERYDRVGRAIDLLRGSTSHVRADWRGMAMAHRLVWCLSTLQCNGERRSHLGFSEWAVNTAPAQALASVLSEAGEDSALKIANAVVAQRPIVSSSHLSKVVAETLELPAPVVNALVASAKPWQIVDR